MSRPGMFLAALAALLIHVILWVGFWGAVVWAVCRFVIPAIRAAWGAP